MKALTTATITFFLSGLLLFQNQALANSFFISDTCMINDDCVQATEFPVIVPDHSFVCLEGCNMNSSPDPLLSDCLMGEFPTVWYRIQPLNASIFNIEVSSKDFESPVISLFKSINGCDQLEQVYLSNGNMACVIGAQGIAKATGTAVAELETYYIAVSSLFSIGGNFEICVSAIEKGSYCVVDRNIQIKARSNGGPLEGPFDPGETISICMNVNQYTAAGNGCQWFQGIVPVFGNGWDPASFDGHGQPIQPTINGEVIGAAGNGVYGAAVWDWFIDVGYHHNNSRLSIADVDNNGTVDLCNSVYEKDCIPAGIEGGCCGPCWADAGDILPPGWFAYGINGTCGIPGPPIAVDWGDGNTCGCCMGPWSFCFDLTTRDIPDCEGDSTRRDLSLGFFTFADGEIGSWTGGESICALDQPVKLSLKSKCGRVTNINTDDLPDMCSGEVFTYKIESPGITYWEWNISPAWVAGDYVNHGINGTIVQVPLSNNTAKPVTVTGTFIGYRQGSQDLLIKKVRFVVNTRIHCLLQSGITFDESNDKPPPIQRPNGNIAGNEVKIRTTITANKKLASIYPIPASDKITVEWNSKMRQPHSILISDTRNVMVRKIEIKDDELKKALVDIGDLTPGMYIVTIVTLNESYVLKMIKD